jgi:hypothetical protein
MKKNAKKKGGRTYPRFVAQLTIEEYIQTFCRDNFHIPATYRIGDKMVKA